MKCSTNGINNKIILSLKKWHVLNNNALSGLLILLPNKIIQHINWTQRTLHGNVVDFAAHVGSKRICLIIIANPMIFSGLSNFTKINISVRGSK